MVKRVSQLSILGSILLTLVAMMLWPTGVVYPIMAFVVLVILFVDYFFLKPHHEPLFVIAVMMLGGVFYLLL